MNKNMAIIGLIVLAIVLFVLSIATTFHGCDVKKAEQARKEALDKSLTDIRTAEQERDAWKATALESQQQLRRIEKKKLNIKTPKTDAEIISRLKILGIDAREVSK